MDQDRFLEILIKKKFNSATLEDMAAEKEYSTIMGYNFFEYSDLIDFPDFHITKSNLSEEALEKKWKNFQVKIRLSDEKGH